MSKKDEALKLALEALEKGNELCLAIGGQTSAVFDPAITAIREALAEQPAQPIKQGWDVDTLLNKPKQPAQQQEPYGWKVYGVNSLFMGEFAEADAKTEAKRIGGTCITFPLYTSPPASKPWVGLTDEEIDECYYWKDRQWTTDELVRYVEAKLREKNA